MIKRLLVITVLFTIIASTSHHVLRSYYWDVSGNKLNQLSNASQNLVSRIDGDLEITINTPSQNTINIFEDVMMPFQQASKQIKVNHQSISSIETLELKYKGHTKTYELSLSTLNEEQISLLVQQVMEKSEHWVAFVSGHGEADPFASDTLGLSEFTRMVQSTGMHVVDLNISQVQDIPNNINTLAVINPQRDFSESEKEILHNFIAHGGNIWWLTEPNSNVTGVLEDEFNITLTPGVVVDPDSLPLGSPHPALKILTQHTKHPITQELSTATVLPWSGNLEVMQHADGWQYTPFMTSNEQSWTYTGPETMDLNVMQQHVDKHGPLNIGYALHKGAQHIIIFADSSFLTNKYLPMYANQDLARNMINWLDDKPVQGSYAATTPIDLNYYPSSLDRLIYNYLWIFIVPFLLLSIGFCIRPH